MVSSGLPSLAEVIERIGWGWAQISQIINGGGVYFADGAELLLIGAVTISLKQEWNLDRTERAMVVSIVFVGVLCGNMLSGPMGDNCGRRIPMLLSYLSVAVFSVLSVLCTEYIWLVIVRFWVGVSFGLGIPAWNALSGEIAPKDQRAYSTIMSQSMFVFGEAYSVVLIFIDDPWMRDLHWRWLILMGAIPAAILLVTGFIMIYEAPSWLALHGQYDKAVDVLRWMAKCNGKPDLDVNFQVAHVVEHGSVCSRLTRNLKIIWGSNLFYTTFTLCFTLFAVNTFYYGGAMYAFLQILPEQTTKTSPALNLLIGVFFEIPGFLLAIWLSYCMSRKATIIFGYFGLFLCCGSFLWMSSVVKQPRYATTGEMGMQASFFMFKCFSGLLFGIVYAYSMEVYPTIARATGTGLSISFGRLGAITSPVLYEWLAGLTDSYYSFFYFMMSLCGIGVVLVFFLPYETKGQALKDHEEEIEPVAPLKECKVVD